MIKPDASEIGFEFGDIERLAELRVGLSSILVPRTVHILSALLQFVHFLSLAEAQLLNLTGIEGANCLPFHHLFQIYLLGLLSTLTELFFLQEVYERGHFFRSTFADGELGGDIHRIILLFNG